MGTKTAMMESVVATTARPISSVAREAASGAGSPDSMWRKLFSRTTMASSIRSPIESERAISVIVFSVNPKK